jgi:hypothetical protein
VSVKKFLSRYDRPKNFSKQSRNLDSTSLGAFFFFATFLLGKEKWRSEFFLKKN